MTVKRNQADEEMKCTLESMSDFNFNVVYFIMCILKRIT